MIASVAPSIIRRRSGLLLINNPILYNCAHKKTTSLIAMYGLNSRAGHLAGIFENNDQTYSVENSRPFIPTKETHANDDHHGHAEHNPDVYHFEVNGPQDVFPFSISNPRTLALKVILFVGICMAAPLGSIVFQSNRT
ncbi:hypothetical protein MDAP_002352 [Mitosporidium daphniae]